MVVVMAVVMAGIAVGIVKRMKGMMANECVERVVVHVGLNRNQIEQGVQLMWESVREKLSWMARSRVN